MLYMQTFHQVSVHWAWQMSASQTEFLLLQRESEKLTSKYSDAAIIQVWT